VYDVGRSALIMKLNSDVELCMDVMVQPFPTLSAKVNCRDDC